MRHEGDNPDPRPFYQVDIWPQGAIVRRTARRYVEISELGPSFADLAEQLDRLSPGADTLLVDLRAAVGRNDGEFEDTIAPLRRQLLRRFERSALLVRTTIGRLQLERYLAADGVRARVFSDEEEATAWFHGEP